MNFKSVADGSKFHYRTLYNSGKGLTLNDKVGENKYRDLEL